MGTNQRFSTQALLAQAGWVRELAASLVSDPNQVDDVVQDTLAVALQQPPVADRPVRAWLATVVRNLIRQDQRTDVRRHDREALAARTEQLPSTLETVERLSIHRELVDIVSELDEPYRTTLLLRFFDGLPPREIAALEGVPVKTVKTRLSRGLERLRERLTERHGAGDGAREGWLGALAPLLVIRAPKPAATLAGTTLGTLVVNVPLKLGLASVVVAGALVGAWAMRDNAPAEQPLDTVAVTPEPDALETPIRLATEPIGTVEGPGRVAATTAPEGESGASTVQAEIPELVSCTVHVLDVDGRPVSGVELNMRAGTDPTGSLLADDEGVALRTSPAGELLVTIPQAGARFEASGTRWTTLYAGVWTPGSGMDPVVVVAEPLSWAGRVLDDDGQPVEGARIEPRLSPQFEASFPLSLEGSMRKLSATLSRADGMWSLPIAPHVPGTRVSFAAEGYTPVAVPAPDHSTDLLDCVLVRHRAGVGNLRGRVVDSAGLGVSEARVAMGAFVTLTDPDGGFALDLGLAVSTASITAIKAGYLPANLTEPERAPGAEHGWDTDVLLELGTTPLELTGQVLGFDGKPVVGAPIWLADPTPFGLMEGTVAQVENLLAGFTPPSGGGPTPERLARFVQRGGYMDQKGVQQRPNATWSWVETDGDGRFVLPGLMDRAYQVCVLDPESLLIEQSGPARPGRDEVLLELQRAKLRPHLDGRVVREDGEALAGVEVQLYVTPFRQLLHIEAATFENISLRPGPTVHTDAEGNFSFTDVPREGIELRVSGEGLLPLELALDDEVDLNDLVLRPASKCSVQVILEAETERADAVVFLDAQGDPLEVFLLRGNAVNVFTDAPLTEGRSGLISVSSRAAELVLILNGEPVERHPITVHPGAPTELRF